MNPENMKIDQNKTVSLIYKLRENDINGKILEELRESKPLKFIFGTGRLLPAFEENLLSLNTGDNFSFNLSDDQAYGGRREELIMNVPLSVFENDGKVDENICRVGNEVPMMDSSGNPLYGTIYEIQEDSVKMDFNHPMAGINLFFSGKILEVRETTLEELSALENSCSGCKGRDHSGCGNNCN
jgi:FKBP-type peptidyl-prolyl cis-trans isomerase SlyD